MESSQFDEAMFFRRLSESGVRALLIGRRALVLLARRHGRYTLENDEHVDVLVARSVPIDGQIVAFDDLWARRETVSVAGADVCLAVDRRSHPDQAVPAESEGP